MKKLESLRGACALVALFLGLASAETSGAQQSQSMRQSGSKEQGQANGTGSSEFEAVKDASKRILSDALALVLGRSATLDEPARRRLERDIEENFRQVHTRFFDAFDYQCEREENVSCNVRAMVDMQELRSAVSTYLDQAAANQLRVAMTIDRNAVTGVDADDALAFIHNGLELQLGYDVYFVDSYIPLDELRNDCRSYEQSIEKYRARGGNFAQTVAKLEAAQDVCASLLDREAIIVVEDIAMDIGTFDANRGVLAGTIKPRIKFLRTDSKRPLPSPLPLEIPKYGEGDSASLARADLNNQMYRDIANYIAQQYSEIVLSRKVRTSGESSTQPRKSSVRITGVSRDRPEGRRALQQIERWFPGSHGELAPNTKSSSRDEHVYALTSDSSTQFVALADDLRTMLENSNYSANVDVDRWNGLTIAFSAEQSLKPPSVAWNDRKAKSVFAIEHSELVTMRQDQSTGVSMSVNVAQIALRNKKRRPYTISVEPVWRDAGGVVIESEFSQRIDVRVESKATRNFRFRAPSRAAAAVEIRVQCDNKKCE